LYEHILFYRTKKEKTMKVKPFTVIFALLVMGTLVLCLFTVLAANATKTEKNKATEAGTAKSDSSKTRGDVDAIIDKVKKKYVCPQINITMEEAEAQGALCPKGNELVDMVRRILEGNASEGDVMNLVENYRIQGQSLVQSTGQPVCESKGKLNLDLFIMSYCPYGVRYIDTTLRPMISDLGDSLNWTPYYILNKNGDKIESMHGQKEVDESLRQICIREKWGREAWLKYMGCFATEIFAKAQSGGAKDWGYCAKQAGINQTELQTCFDKDAKTMAEKDIQISSKFGAGGSPTAIYNCGKRIVGAIPYQNIKTSVCKMYSSDAPGVCMKK
jgi:hypothetical protein